MLKFNKLILVLVLFSVIYSETRVVAYSYCTDPSSDLEDYSKLTHIVGSFINSDSLGNLCFLSWFSESDMLSVLQKAEGFGVIPMIALGTTKDGWKMTKSKSARASFIDNIVNYCISKNIKGIDLDLEGVAEEFNWGNPGTFFPEPYESLAVELRAAMPDSMILTAAIGSHSRNGAQWTDNFLNTLDWVNIMIYDRALSWETSSVVNHSTYNGQIEAAQYWNSVRGISKDRISLGVPFYARGWDRDNNRIYKEDPGWDVTTWGYKFFIDKYSIPLNQDTMDITAEDTIRYARAAEITGKATLFFNSPTMIAKKTQWAIDNGYSGMMIWHFDQDLPIDDERSLLRAMDSVINQNTSLNNNSIKRENKLMKFSFISNLIHIQDLQKGKDYTVKLYDLKGKMIYSETIKSNHSSLTLNALSENSKGVYLLSLSYSGGKINEIIIKK